MSEHPPPAPKRLNFDPTINLGHVLTALTMLGTGAAAYSVLSTRVAVLEERSATALMRTGEQAAEQKESIREIRTDIKEMQRTLSDVARNVASNLPRRTQ